MSTNNQVMEDNERLQIQLAACLAAAEGCVAVKAEQGDWAWSPAYEKICQLQEANTPIKRYTAKETVLSYFGGGLCLFGMLALFLGHETAGLALIIQGSASLMTGAALRAERLADALGVRVVD